ncbi:GntR family transcriptional regulator [Desulfosarcina alkanivorans]|uniref:GntR family transcriptional regulator n=1 Tax=Desulfosarcina alkanivorans TaxID=571177 RepID=A0A5K7YN79_9BACT|nr:GntR family transcriptional regulator [Desulfosarcina alkanivorans]BBO69863.1 GntR family transcriptional regulator [Desulfosarcina alkanivorans]
MDPKQIEKKPLRDVIYSELVDNILQGRINSGEKLVEADLAKRFSVSRTPIREALLHLEKEGYIEHIKNVGATVRKISPQKVEEIFRVIAILESEAAEMVAEAGFSESEILNLQKLHDEMSNAAKAKDFIEYNHLNIQFHQFFLDRCNNATIANIAKDLRNKMYRMVSEGLSLPMNVDKYLNSHHQIMEALVGNKPKTVQRLMKAHILEASKALVEMMIRKYS